jgi:cytochrome c-type biogenesis protein CcmH
VNPVWKFCMRWLCALGFAAVMLTTTVPAFAVQPDEVLADSRLETRARTLSRELRCMVCQNQSIDDSDAPLARDLRLLVRERLKAGDSDTQIIDFLVARYGHFVLLRPRFEWETALLWLTPLLVLLNGLVAAGAAWRSRQRAVAELSESVMPLSPAEEKRLAELVSGPDR